MRSCSKCKPYRRKYRTNQTTVGKALMVSGGGRSMSVPYLFTFHHFTTDLNLELTNSLFTFIMSSTFNTFDIANVNDRRSFQYYQKNDTSNYKLETFYSVAGAKDAHLKDSTVMFQHRVVEDKKRKVFDLQNASNAIALKSARHAKRHRVIEFEGIICSDNSILQEHRRELVMLKGLLLQCDDQIDQFQTRIDVAETEVEEEQQKFKATVVSAKRKYKQLAHVDAIANKKIKLDREKAMQKKRSKKHQMKKRKVQAQNQKELKQQEAAARQQREELALATFEERRFVQTPLGRVLVDKITDHGDGMSFSGTIEGTSMKYSSGYVFTPLACKPFKHKKEITPNAKLNARIGYVPESR